MSFPDFAKVQLDLGYSAIYGKPVWDFNVELGEFEDRGQFEGDYDVQMMTIKVVTTEPGK